MRGEGGGKKIGGGVKGCLDGAVLGLASGAGAEGLPATEGSAASN